MGGRSTTHAQSDRVRLGGDARMAAKSPGGGCMRAWRFSDHLAMHHGMRTLGASLSAECGRQQRGTPSWTSAIANAEVRNKIFLEIRLRWRPRPGLAAASRRACRGNARRPWRGVSRRTPRELARDVPAGEAECKSGRQQLDPVQLRCAFRADDRGEFRQEGLGGERAWRDRIEVAPQPLRPDALG